MHSKDEVFTTENTHTHTARQKHSFSISDDEIYMKKIEQNPDANINASTLFRMYCVPSVLHAIISQKCRV